MIDHLLRMRRTKAAYERLFPIERGQLIGDANTVMADLARFCRPRQPPIQRDATGATDTYQSGMRAGRQEVFNRIMEAIHMDASIMFNLKEDDE